MSPSKLTRRLEKVEDRLTPPARAKTIVVIDYVSAETKTVVATQTIDGGVIGPVIDVELPRPLNSMGPSQ